MKHSKRICLGTYILDAEGRPTLFSSFAEGEFEIGGLREAIKDAEKSRDAEDWPQAYKNGERGICVAVFSHDITKRSRVVSVFPWSSEPVACFEAQGPFCTDPWNMTQHGCS